VPLGATVIIHPFLSLEGDFGGASFGAGLSFAGLKIEDLSSPSLGLPPGPHSEGRSWGSYVSSGGGEFLNEVPGLIRLESKFINGSFGTFGLRFTLFGDAQSDDPNTFVQSAKDGGASVSGDASRSLRWGGIESVTDEVGNPITDWTIISDDGFDYSRPFGVPEPASMALLGFALLPLAFSRRRIVRR
jgi:hypothetical protein